MLPGIPYIGNFPPVTPKIRAISGVEFWIIHIGFIPWIFGLTQ
jgi:hypothetical protein